MRLWVRAHLVGCSPSDADKSYSIAVLVDQKRHKIDKAQTPPDSASGNKCVWFMPSHFAFFSPAPLSAGEVKGVPRIVDADTVYVEAQKIRLSGRRCPGDGSDCLDSRGQNLAVALEAKDRLQDHSAKSFVDLPARRRRRYGRTSGPASGRRGRLALAGGENGWALAFRRYSAAYVADEDYAREHKNGLWSGAFVAPWDGVRRDAKNNNFWARCLCRQMHSAS